MPYIPKSEREKLHAHRGPGGKCLRGEASHERTDWEGIAREWDQAPGSMGKFHRALCQAIQYADTAGIERLRKAYPELVKLIKGE
jgi:hypothetical protein